MDTLSRDSNNSGSILPLVGVIAGGLALVLAIVALVKLSTLQKTVMGQADEIAKIEPLSTEMRASAAKAANDLKALHDGFQNAFNDVGTTVGAINARITKIEDAMKKPVAATGGKGAPAPTGVMNADGTYSVAPGDTLSKIAKKFAVRVDAILAENPGVDPAKLRVGQKIHIPKK